jgi:hypothetical protein
MIRIVPVPSLPLVLTKADHHFRAHDTRPGENIDDFQAARLGRAGGVETNPKEGAVATGKQTFVEQEFDFLLREYLGLPVPFYLHAWCIPDPTPESLPHLLYYTKLHSDVKSS